MSLSLGHAGFGRAARDKGVELADSALDSLDWAGRQRPETAVHDTRKRCKEIRALLRLVRPGLDEGVYRLENELFRDAARILSPMRDAQAVLDCFDEFVATGGGRLAVPAGAARDELQRRAQRVTADIRGDDTRVAEARELITAGRVAVSRWHLEDDWDVARAGMTRVYRQGRHGLRRSRRGGDAHDFHDWRKRVKYLWYHAQMLADRSPDHLGPLTTDLEVLSDTIGTSHDLHVLAKTLRAHPDRYGGDHAVCTVTEVADSERADLERQAVDLGAKVYADKPKAFMRRM